MNSNCSVRSNRDGANRHYLPGHIWYIIHRHRSNFVQDVQVVQSPGSSPGSVQNVQSRYSEAKKRFGLCVLDYVVTSNHIHLRANAGSERFRIPVVPIADRMQEDTPTGRRRGSKRKKALPIRSFQPNVKAIVPVLAVSPHRHIHNLKLHTIDVTPPYRIPFAQRSGHGPSCLLD